MRRMKMIMCVLVFALLMGGMTFVFHTGMQGMQKHLRKPEPEQHEKTYANAAQAYKAAREGLRKIQKAQLNDIAHSSDSDQKLREMAQRQLIQLCKREETECCIEGILDLQGWQGSVAAVNEDCINVFLNADAVSEQESRVIMEQICTQSGVQSGNVKIIPIN